MKVLYPGTFDPVTIGHMDVIQTAKRLFDEVLVAVMRNPSKKCIFPTCERAEMIQRTLNVYGWSDKVKVLQYDGLVGSLVKREHADAIIRGLKLVMDYEAELDMSFNNTKLSGGIPSIFIAPKQEHLHIRSSTVRGLLSFAGDISDYVPCGAYGFMVEEGYLGESKCSDQIAELVERPMEVCDDGQ